jgi:hypothetical protein
VKFLMIRTLTIAIFVIAVIAMMTAGQVYAKKNHSAGTRCDFGANHDICNDPGKGKHFESCEDKGGDIGNVCDIINNDGTPNQ